MTKNERHYIKKKLHYGILIWLMVVSCDDLGSNNNGGPLDTVYVALQGLDQVAVVNINSSEIDFVDIDYATMSDQGSHTPHFIEIDEINRFWFVTTISSGYVGLYNLDTDAFIDAIMVGD